jgi:hypothetical protein
VNPVIVRSPFRRSEPIRLLKCLREWRTFSNHPEWQTRFFRMKSIFRCAVDNDVLGLTHILELGVDVNSKVAFFVIPQMSFFLSQ